MTFLLGKWQPFYKVLHVYPGVLTCATVGTGAFSLLLKVIFKKVSICFHPAGIWSSHRVKPRLIRRIPCERQTFLLVHCRWGAFRETSLSGDERGETSCVRRLSFRGIIISVRVRLHLFRRSRSISTWCHIFLRRQRTWPFELKLRFNSSIFAMFKTSSCQESKKKQKRNFKKIGRVSSHPGFLASLYITWLISRAFWHVSLLLARKQDVCFFDTARKKAF